MQQPAVAALIAAIFAGACYLAIIGSLLRATSGRHALTIFVGVAVLLLAAVPMFAGSMIGFWHFAAFFAAAVAVIVFLYGAVLKSLSLTMLVEMSRARGHAVSLDDLTDRVVRPAFSTRADLLADLGGAARDGAGYRITQKGEDAAKRIQAARRFLKLNSIGLYGS